MLIEVKNLNKIYKSAALEFHALKDVTFSMEKGQIAVILGPSGSGKSTLLNILGGIDFANSGTADIDGQKITEFNSKKLQEYRREKIGFVFQFYNLIPNLTVYENICVAEDISQNPLDIDALIKDIGLFELRDRYPQELSGGQQQRVSVARALVKNPKLLFCDEPTGALDYESSKEILDLIEKITRKYQMTTLIITHNAAIAGMADKVIKLRSGEIVEDIIQKNPIHANEVEW
ncbi:ABC transporter ATP-binding protein [Eubacteriaceae bacterium ES3]|nr:ABC transporter ATP-binding protein [Eubacteriaceae bacterium ES3]